MADFDAVGDVLALHFATQMALNEPTVKIAYRNGPKLTTEPDPKSTEWVRYSWLPIDDRAAAIGGSFYRGLGMVDVQVFTPLGRGTGASERIERSIQELFRDEDIAGVVVGPITFGSVGETSGWYQTQVRIRIHSDESL